MAHHRHFYEGHLAVAQVFLDLHLEVKTLPLQAVVAEPLALQALVERQQQLLQALVVVVLVVVLVTH